MRYAGAEMPIPVPVATEHRVEVSAGFELEFECPRCGPEARARARVFATSEGSAMGAPLSLAASRPLARAEARARAGLDEEAKALLALARCPRCRARSSEAVRDWWLVHAIQTAVVVAFFVGVPLFFFGAPLAPVMTGGLVVLGALAYLVARFRVRLWRVDKRVTFGSDVGRAPGPR